MTTAQSDPRTPRSEKRALILAAAQRLFLANGYKRTSMEAIRAAAGVSKPTLYNHYADKEALFADVVRVTFNHLGIERFPLVAGQSLPIHTRDQLRTVLIAFVTQAMQQMMASEYVALLRIVISEMPHFPQLMDIFRQNGPARGLAIAGQFFALAYQQGLIRVADTEVVARLFIGPMASYILTEGLLQSGTGKLPDQARITMHVDLFLQAVCA
ncbi:MAG: TetR/AcrR family transcriptional regulator [Roseiflexaceae bacterium]